MMSTVLVQATMPQSASQWRYHTVYLWQLSEQCFPTRFIAVAANIQVLPYWQTDKTHIIT